MSGQPTSLSIVDRVVSWIDPVEGLRRMAARQALTQFGYHAVNQTRSRGSSGGLFQNASPSSAAMERDRIQLIWESRDQELNMPFTRGLLNRTAHFAFPRVVYQANTGDRQINKVHEDYIAEKAKKVDLQGRFSLQKLCELSYRSEWRDGDCGHVMSEDSGEFKLQPFEADCIGDVQRAQSSDEKDIGGFLLNDLGQLTGVKLYTRTRNNQYHALRNAQGQDAGPIPPSRWLHIVDPFRLSQVRGHSPLASVHADVRDLYEVFTYDMMGIKFAASFAGIFQAVNPNDPNGAGAWTGKDSQSGLNYLEAQSGRIFRAPEGHKIDFAPASNRPSGSFLNFVELKVRMIMNALDLPFAFGWDLAKFGGVTARLETRYADHRFQYDRDRMTVQLLDPWKDSTLARGIAAGEIPAHPNYKRGKWNFGGKISADILNDTNARILAIQQGLTTATDEIENAGGDFERVTETQAQEVKIMQQVSARTGVPIELLCQRLITPTANLAAMNERGNAGDPNAAAGPPAPAGLLASHEPASAKLILDVIKQFNQGLMAREEAMGTLMQLFGISVEEAAMMMPNELPIPQPQPEPAPAPATAKRGVKT